MCEPSRRRPPSPAVDGGPAGSDACAPARDRMLCPPRRDVYPGFAYGRPLPGPRSARISVRTSGTTDGSTDVSRRTARRVRCRPPLRPSTGTGTQGGPVTEGAQPGHEAGDDRSGGSERRFAPGPGCRPAVPEAKSMVRVLPPVTLPCAKRLVAYGRTGLRPSPQRERQPVVSLQGVRRSAAQGAGRPVERGVRLGRIDRIGRDGLGHGILRIVTRETRRRVVGTDGVGGHVHSSARPLGLLAAGSVEVGSAGPLDHGTRKPRR